jgi:hypothetical protein
MDNPGIQLFINVCITLIGLIVLKVALQVWDRKVKAKEAAQAETAKVIKKKKK